MTRRMVRPPSNACGLIVLAVAFFFGIFVAFFRSLMSCAGAG